MILREATRWAEEMIDTHLSEIGFRVTEIGFTMFEQKVKAVTFHSFNYSVRVEPGDFLQLRYIVLHDPESPLSF